MGHVTGEKNKGSIKETGMNHNKEQDKKVEVVGSCNIDIQKFSDGTCRPMVKVTNMSLYELIGMLELIKLETAEKSWTKAAEIRKKLEQ